MALTRTRLGAIAVALVVMGGACSDDPDGSTTTDGASVTTTGSGAPDTTSGSGETGDGPCDPALDPVKLGAVYSLSGPLATVGERFQTGTEAAVDAANAAGGVLGACIELTIQDDTNDPTKGSQAVRQLVDEAGVDFVVGPFSSTALGATLPITNAAQVLQFTGSGLPDAGDATANPYTFRVTNNTQANAQSFVQFALDSGWENVAILAVNQALGTSNLDLVRPALEAEGITVTAATFESGTVDLTPQLSSLMDGDPDGLITFANGADQVSTLSARSLLGIDIPTLALSTAAEPDVVEAAGVEQMNNVFSPGVAQAVLREPGEDTPQGESFAAFIDLMHDVLGQNPVQASLQIPAIGYDSVMIYVDTANAVGSTDSDEIRAYLEENGYDGVYGSYSFTDTDHNGLGVDQLGTAVTSSFRDGSLERAG